MKVPFLKGHGTHNDFLVLPDLDGTLLGDLDPGLVAQMCDRRGGLGADGVLRVIHTRDEAPWFMDYRNADGSVAEMCGNGVRVYARYLAEAKLVDVTVPLTVDTRDGLKTVTFCDDDEISVDMGLPVTTDEVTVSVAGRVYAARGVDMGNPHAVAVVESLEQLGELIDSPIYCAVAFPRGVNTEFAERRGSRHVAMRVFERGVGETASCGTGACAVAAVMVRLDDEAAPTSYAVDVPGGRLTVTLDAAHRAHLKGPAVLVAEGTWRA